jgi:hypothetical protein
MPGWILIVVAILFIVALGMAHRRSLAVPRVASFSNTKECSCSRSSPPVPEPVEFRTVRQITERDREAFRQVWESISGHFENDPRIVVVYADLMVSELISAAPRTAFENFYGAEAARRSRLWESYRNAHEIASQAKCGSAKTEELHRAMILYTALFDELLARRRSASQHD